jgi:hypothetical protein
MQSSLDIVQEKDRKRYALLMKLWEAASGSEVSRVSFTKIAEQAGLNRDEQNEIYRYFDSEGFFSTGDAGGGVILSHRAILEIEQSIRNPKRATEHFAATVIQNFNAPVGAVQTGAQSSSIVTQNFGSNAREVLALISELRESFEKLPIGERGDTLEVVDALSEEVAAENPRKGRVKAYLAQLGSVAIKVGSEALVSAIAKQLTGAS